jgi:glycine C-acetyltransferase
MGELRDALRSCEPGRRKLVLTDGVFSMEGDLARLPDILELARAHEAVVLVDDSHGVGAVGATGRGVAEHYGVLGQVDVVTGTLGKALGGAAGGYVASTEEVCELLAQRSRPQLFSNALPPTVACSARAAIGVMRAQPRLLTRLHENTRWFREALQEAGFAPLEGESAIIPIIVGETAHAIELSERLLERGVFVTGFGYPVVPEGKARIRVQMSAALEREHLERALEAFVAVGRESGLLTR